jgi:hypothetical protein
MFYHVRYFYYIYTMKHINLFEDFLNESEYSDAKADLSAKASDILQKRRELRDKVNDLNQKADDPKSAIQAQIATLKMSLLELDNQKIRISGTILDLSNKLSNL